jgi:hypothetical protein
LKIALQPQRNPHLSFNPKGSIEMHSLMPEKLLVFTRNKQNIVCQDILTTICSDIGSSIHWEIFICECKFHGILVALDDPVIASL